MGVPLFALGGRRVLLSMQCVQHVQRLLNGCSLLSLAALLTKQSSLVSSRQLA
jgi:hypothetical protein